jgi:hypothetical protein
LISEQTADAAVAYLGLYNVKLTDLFPDEKDPAQLEEKLVQLVVGLTDLAILTCVYDYKGEVAHTINFVDQWLEANDVSYW